MAQLKYKDANGNWAQLNAPLNVINGESAREVEYVEITGSSIAHSLFPDLTPYISDISDIALMTWTTADVNGSYFSSKTFIYCPSAMGDKVRQKESEAKGTVSASSAELSLVAVSDYSKGYTLVGTPAQLYLQNNSGNNEPLGFYGIINLYYYKEGAN